MSVHELPSLIFSAGEWVVCPNQGIARVVGIQKENISGRELEALVIEYGKDDCEKIPTHQIYSSGLRKVSDEKTINAALETLKEKKKVKVKKFKKSSHYKQLDEKINTGNLVYIAEVIRDLYRNEENDKGRSNTETDVYEKAVKRFSGELSVYNHCSEDDAKKQIKDILAKAQAVQI